MDTAYRSDHQVAKKIGACGKDPKPSTNKTKIIQLFLHSDYNCT